MKKKTKAVLRENENNLVELNKIKSRPRQVGSRAKHNNFLVFLSLSQKYNN